MAKILIVGLNFHPEPIGIGKYSGEMAEYLAGRGHQVRVITAPPFYPHWQVPPGRRAWTYQRENHQGIEIQRCPLWVPRQPTGLTRLLHLASFALSSLPALLAQWRWKPSLVVCVAPALLNAPFALLFARLSGAKAWLHIQDFELDAALKLGLLPGGKWLAGLAARFERFLLNGFDKVSSISERMLMHLLEKGLPRNKVTLFPNWVDTRHIHPLGFAPNPIHADLGLAPGKVIVLYAGAMGKKQGLEHLLAAAGSLQDQAHIQFILCGDGAARAKLEQSAQGMSNVRFLPVQPYERLNHLLNLADVHILPQMAGAADLVMPSKLGGMLASGRAILATADPNTELGKVTQQVGVLVPPEDPAALANAIVGLVNDPLKRKRLGGLGREYACAHLEKEKILAQFEDALISLVAGYEWRRAASPSARINIIQSFWRSHGH